MDIPERDRRAYVAPLLSTLLTLPAAAVTLFFAGLSPMACDSCADAASDRFDASFGPAWTVFTSGLVLVLLLLVACWALPRNHGYRGRRLALALAAPGAVVLNVLVFAAMVDWP
ncbi:hypothetical protein ABZW32_10430 [Streptomyces sp. NPDC004667]|uniref:hypothetical protein n=1 Tax=Streptomyces sp. NPDC004667 TaxID=3154285 RepID=UPI0033BA6CAA